MLWCRRMQPCHRIHLSHRDLLTPSIATHSNVKHKKLYDQFTHWYRAWGEVKTAFYFWTRSLQTLFHRNKIRNKNAAVLSQSPRRGHQQFCFCISFPQNTILFPEILFCSLKYYFGPSREQNSILTEEHKKKITDVLTWVPSTGHWWFVLIVFRRTTVLFPQDSILRKWNKKYKLRCALPGSAHCTLWSVSYCIIWISK